MAFEFHLPDIGEGVVEGEIVSWKVKVGDKIALDEPMVEVMTDKATVEIPSPRAGVITAINFQEGEICPVGDVLVVIEDGSGGGKVPAEAAAPAAPAAAGAPAGEVPAKADGPTGSACASAPAPAATGQAAAESGRPRVLATPATRRLARKLSVDLRRVTPTGKRGRVTSDDVRRHAAQPTAPAAVAAPTTAAALPTPVNGQITDFVPVSIPADEGPQNRIPFRGMRKRIASNMTRSKLTAAHFTYVEEVDMTELHAVRAQAKVRAEERGIKLTYLPFIIKAIVSGLKKWPQLNAALDETTQELVHKLYYHVGIATQGPQGLMVTVIRDADRRSIFGLAQEIARLSEAARTGKATREELTGSTFTITSLGKLGGVLATPIINFPEVAIVGVHKMEQKPAVRDGEIVIRWLMNLSISVDHRLADGWDGAMFLQDVKNLLEDPTTMFMEMV